MAITLRSSEGWKVSICVCEIARTQRDSKVVRFWDEIIANERFICDDDFDGYLMVKQGHWGSHWKAFTWSKSNISWWNEKISYLCLFCPPSTQLRPLKYKISSKVKFIFLAFEDFIVNQINIASLCLLWQSFVSLEKPLHLQRLCRCKLK